MIQTGSLWEESIDRIGRWVEFKDAYKTMDASYMESVWWAFKRLYEAARFMRVKKCWFIARVVRRRFPKPRWQWIIPTVMVRDPSVYVKFGLPAETAGTLLKKLGYGGEPVDSLSLLAWTTTPWTLPANTAVAVNPALEYALIVSVRTAMC